MFSAGFTAVSVQEIPSDVAGDVCFRQRGEAYRAYDHDEPSARCRRRSEIEEMESGCSNQGSEPGRHVRRVTLTGRAGDLR